MKSLSLILIALFAIPIGQSLKCHYCNSFTSWKDCEMKEQVVQCAEEMTNCAFGYFYGKSEQYMKGCRSTHECDSYCNTATNLRACYYRCCTGDFCNYGSNPNISMGPIVPPFTCYKCHSNSMPRCEMKIEVVCPRGERTCMEGTVTDAYGSTEYIMGCVSESACRNKKKVCSFDPEKKCDIHCCNEKLCSGLLSGGRISILDNTCAFLCLIISVLAIMKNYPFWQ